MVTKIPILHEILHSTANNFPSNTYNTHSNNRRYHIIGRSNFILLLIIDRLYLSFVLKVIKGFRNLILRNPFIIFLIEFGHGYMHLLTAPKNQSLLPEDAEPVVALPHGIKYDFQSLLPVGL